MADKDTELSIVIRTVDKATAKIRAINKRLDEITRPTREFGKALKELGEKSGFNDVVTGFKDVGGAVKDLVGKVIGVGGVVGAAALGVFHLVGEFDDLGDASERLGVTNDFLASMRYAAERSGASMEALDTGLTTFVENLGQARAGTGRMVKFLSTVSPALLSQLKATKSNEAAFRLLADAMAKVQDPAKRAALAQKTVGDSALAPLLARGSEGLLELQGAFANLAGSQEDAAEGAGQVDDSLRDLKAATTGIKAALVSGLSPALRVIVDQLKDWLVDHREDVKHWAEDIGKKLPGAVDEVVRAVSGAVKDVRGFVDSIGGWKVAAGALAVVLAGPLLTSIASLGAALLATPFGVVLAGLAAVAAGVTSLTIEIQKFYDALDTSHEKDAEEMYRDPEGWRRKHQAEMDADPALQEALRRERELLAQGGDALPENAMVATANQPGLQSLLSLMSPPAAQETRIKVDFANAPKGLRVTTADPQNTAKIDTTVGYQMEFGP